VLSVHGLSIIEWELAPISNLRKVAEADFPSEYGHFRILGFAWRPETEVDAPVEEVVVVSMGDLTGPPPLVRIHSQCLTGDVFHSLRCDCRAQLELALETIAAEGRGAVVYEHQEGRGIGLLNKLRAYELQDQGADTVEANERLGFAADLRGFAAPAEVIRALGLRAVRLMSNNPEKIGALENVGVAVVERVSAVTRPVETSAEYLRTKREKLGHLL
jgi:GTP cyclohydrolase II